MAIGLLVVVAGVLLVWGLYFLMGNPVWRSTTDVTLVLDDAAGLKRNDRVQVHGVQVGTVRGVHLQGAGRVVVDLRLDEGIDLPADTRARLTADVFGTNTVVLVPGTAATPLQAGDTILGAASPALPDLVEDLGGKARSILASADLLFSPQTVADVQETAAVLPAGAQELLAAFRELNLAAASLRRTAQSVEGAEAGPALAQALQELQGSAQAFTQAANAMEASMEALASIMTKIDQGNGTLGRLVNDSTVYAEMSTTLREVRLLATDLRENPKRYINVSVF